MLGRHVGEKIKANSAGFPFEHVTTVLKEADIVFGNLECPLSLRGERCQTKAPDVPFLRAHPDVVEGLVQAGFNVLSLANNHILNFGEEALWDTTALLERNGIHYIGVGANLKEARKPLLLVRNGLKIAFLAYCSQFIADDSHAGNPPLDYPVIREDVIKAKKHADLVIVSLHFGLEYSSRPLPLQRRMVHRIIDDGATLILGHHPHLLQGIEPYKGGLIAYSLGCFVFDTDEVVRLSTSSQVRHLGAKFFEVDPALHNESLILRCELTKHGIEDLELVPIRINADHQPVIARGEDGQQILARLRHLSDTLGDEGAMDRLQDVALARSLSRRFKENPVAMLLRAGRIRRYHLRLVGSLLKGCGKRLCERLRLARDPDSLG
jgi:poly-gamma-glutamate synthesis protein (capsule biosynthesis protein)